MDPKKESFISRVTWEHVSDCRNGHDGSIILTLVLAIVAFILTKLLKLVVSKN